MTDEEIKEYWRTAYCNEKHKKEELEKENAELKLKLESLEGQTPWKDIKDKSEVIGKLNEAKDLLKRCYENYIYLEPLRSEIEQFLNSEVEK
jgi:rubredoxin